MAYACQVSNLITNTLFYSDVNFKLRNMSFNFLDVPISV